LGKGDWTTANILIWSGALIVIFSAILGIYMFYTYSPLLPAGGTLEESLSFTVYELMNIVIRIAFLGIAIWAGAILMSKGIEMGKRPSPEYPPPPKEEAK